MFWIRLRNFINSSKYYWFMLVITLSPFFLLMLSGQLAADENGTIAVGYIWWLTAVLMILTMIPLWIIRRSIRHQQRMEDRQINLMQDASGEKNFTRELTKNEQTYLRDQISHFWIDVLVAIGIGFVVGLVLNDMYPQRDALLLCFGIGLSISSLKLIDIFTKNRQYYLDLRTDAVMRVRGDLIREIDESKRDVTVHFVVRGIRFSSIEIPAISRLRDRFSEDELVEVEFSPHSHLVHTMKSAVHPEKNINLAELAAQRDTLQPVSEKGTKKRSGLFAAVYFVVCKYLLKER